MVYGFGLANPSIVRKAFPLPNFTHKISRHLTGVSSPGINSPITPISHLLDKSPMMRFEPGSQGSQTVANVLPFPWNLFWGIPFFVKELYYYDIEWYTPIVWIILIYFVIKCSLYSFFFLFYWGLQLYGRRCSVDVSLNTTSLPPSR